MVALDARRRAPFAHEALDYFSIAAELAAQHFDRNTSFEIEMKAAEDDAWVFVRSDACANRRGVRLRAGAVLDRTSAIACWRTSGIACWRARAAGIGSAPPGPVRQRWRR